MVVRKAIIDKVTGEVLNIVKANDDFDPGPGRMLLDVADAQKGGMWDGAQFLPPPAPRVPTDADRAEALVRGDPALLALGRIVMANDALTEDGLVAALRSKLP